MTNREKYDHIFFSVFGVQQEDLLKLSFKKTPEWDSVGHMGLISDLEEKFNILMEAEDIFGFTTYEKGEEILRKYGIEL